MITGLPVAGFTGSLAYRFADRRASAGSGHVRAKTGTLSGVSSLAGVVDRPRRHAMVFVLAVDRAGEDTSTPEQAVEAARATSRPADSAGLTVVASG